MTELTVLSASDWADTEDGPAFLPDNWEQLYDVLQRYGDYREIKARRLLDFQREPR